jgi:nicotinate-nucleotide adenylyltransferase
MGGLRLEPAFASRRAAGLYGGSFDPVHEGHVHVARTARARAGLGQVVWLVSPGNPLKGGAAHAYAARLEAVRRSAGGMVVSDLEARLGTRYSVDLLRALQKRRLSSPLVWVMGADSLLTFHRWKAWCEIFRRVPILVVSRQDLKGEARFSPAARRFAKARLPASQAPLLARRRPPAWVFLPAPYQSISSTEIRKRHGHNAQG